MFCKPEDLIGLGMPGELANKLGISLDLGVTATGNDTAANGYQIKATVTTVTTAGASTNTLRLPSAATWPGAFLFIANAGTGQTLNVYPASGEKIAGGSADAKQTLANNARRLYIKTASNDWYTTAFTAGA